MLDANQSVNVCLLISAFKHLSPEEEELEYYEMPLKYGVE